MPVNWQGPRDSLAYTSRQASSFQSSLCFAIGIILTDCLTPGQMNARQGLMIVAEIRRGGWGARGRAERG